MAILKGTSEYLQRFKRLMVLIFLLCKISIKWFHFIGRYGVYNKIKIFLLGC